MSVVQLTEPSAAQLQLAVYNQNIGGMLSKSMTLSAPASTNWAIVGIVLADAATAADVENTLVPAIEALDEVVSVNGDQLFGQIPATIQATGYQCVLHVIASATVNVGSESDYFSQTTRTSEMITPPLGKKWVVVCLRTPAALDATSIAELEAAIDGITGVTSVEHLIDGVVSSRAVSSATIKVDAHMRLEYVEA